MAAVIVAPDYPTDYHWPVTVRYGSLMLTPLRPRDVADAWDVRARNAAWLSPWDATAPTPVRPVDPRARARVMWRSAKRGRTVPWLIRWSDSSGRPAPIIGQVTVSNIVYGSAMAASVGYWIDRGYAGRSLMPAAVALASDHAMKTMGLHRIEICIRPENAASLKVVQKLGFRYEGRRPRFIHIAGAWRDHAVFALTSEEVPQGLVARIPEAVVFPDRVSTHGWVGPSAGAGAQTPPEAVL
ncbi:MAG: GNAT family N-acetyltransferase [Propionibacteriaceae bacterium]|jgi:ribosomal-protein-alanine N-acetyltransferase|nr:GNAT family N-acetyltransferase [Propionibacteriaceae bacterium]